MLAPRRVRVPTSRVKERSDGHACHRLGGTPAQVYKSVSRYTRALIARPAWLTAGMVRSRCSRGEISLAGVGAAAFLAGAGVRRGVAYALDGERGVSTRYFRTESGGRRTGRAGRLRGIRAMGLSALS